ncbi:hypothetical protein C2G38_2045778 [Gigaspora rosea]|uniref:FAR1 domain-containing protein n=1 Tax=Gigaspora rosea TaxID=44941 RepID=A0A397UF49_9GLOM|nr:hypothetical protein C2G38_2045778 [Gigaspora rosea]
MSRDAIYSLYYIKYKNYSFVVLLTLTFYQRRLIYVFVRFIIDKKLDEFLTVNEYPEDFLIVNEYPEDFLVVNEYPEDFLVVNEYPKDFLVVNEANKESEHSGEISSDLVMNKEVMDSEFEIEGYDDMLSQNEIESSSLFSGKQFDTWDECELFLNKWAKNKEFRLIKGHVTWENGFLRRRTYLCDHGGSYESNTVKDTVTKKTQCPYLINVSCPKINNIECSILLTK